MADSPTNEDAAVQADRLLGELLSQLSLRCHEQNWAQVHAIAEQIALHKRKPKQNEEGQLGQLAEASWAENNPKYMDGSAGAGGSASYGQGILKSPRGPSSHPNTLHMLSTCLGTASPLAWTCRYSAPASTVKLVLDLDLSAVRRCLPQLGTPLHEIVGRPRPLRKKPHKQSRWTSMIGNSIAAARGGEAPAQVLVKSPSPKQEIIGALSFNKRRNKNLSIPRILKGLHVWRRTVRALIQADEILLREDAKFAAAKAKNVDSSNEDRRLAIQTMIKENVRNINTFKAATECGGDAVDDQSSAEFQEEKSQSNQSRPIQARCFPFRATMAQDADGNTPLHFMIRGAASPSLGGVGWQSHHDLDDDEDDCEGAENAGEIFSRSELHVDHAKDNTGQDRNRDLPRNDYGGMSSTSWDGIRWCMEAHLRRVERRVARQLRLEKQIANGHDGNTDEKREIELGVASVRIDNPVDIIHAEMRMSGEDYNNYTSVRGATNLKSSSKRKSLEIFSEGAKPSKKPPASPESSSQLEATGKDFGNRKRLRLRRNKYFDADDHQDSCYDPLLGAVHDLVYSCPEAVGIPDNREYEETPLIVALKSSIYVLMEPDTDFQVVERLTGNDGAAVPQLPGGVDGEQNGDGFADFGLPNGGGRDFPFPDLAVLFHNRPINIFQDDQAMMAVLRGHGRRSLRGSRSLSSASRPPVVESDNYCISASNDSGKSQRLQQRNGQANEEFEIENDDDHSSCSSVSDDLIDDPANDPRYDAFVSGAHEEIFSVGVESPGSRLGLLPIRRPRYDYRTALEYRIFSLVRIMLDAYPRAACLMISDYTPLHSAVFHGRCPETIRLLLEAEARFRSSANFYESQVSPVLIPPQPMLCPTLPGPALLCTNTRGELPLHFACMSNQCVRSIRLLVGADPRAALVRDASGRTPLRWLWIRFVDGLLDRFGGRDTQGHNNRSNLGFMEQEGGYTPNFPNMGQRVMGLSHNRSFSINDALHGRCYDSEWEDMGTSNSMFVFDVGYIIRTRNIDRTVDFLRMRHIPSQFEHIENVAAEHAITVLLKLKYLQERRARQLAAYDIARSSNSKVNLPPDTPMSVKEEFILCAFEKFTALIHAALVASEAEEKHAVFDASCNRQSEINDEMQADVSHSLSRKKLWHSLPNVSSNKRFFLVHEACRSSRASCPAAVAKICIKLFSDQLFEQDDDGQLPLHKVACRGLGWEPPGSDHDTSCASLADETLILLKLVLSESHIDAPQKYDNNKQLPLHCAIDSLVTSLTMGKKRRATLHAEARVVLQKYRHTHVEIAMDCLKELLRANSQALSQRDGKTGLYPFMQAAVPHGSDNAVVKYTSDLSRRSGFDVGSSFSSIEREVVEESDVEAECDHTSIIYFLLREDPSVLNNCC